MDVLTSVLDGPRARNAFMLRALLGRTFSVHVEDGCPLEVVTVLAGQAWACPDDGPAVHLSPGDVAVVRSDRPWTLTDSPGREASIVIHPGQRCTTADGRELADELTLGVRSWGPDPSGTTTVLVGAYSAHRQVTQPLLDLLPRVAVLTAEQLDPGLLRLIDGELDRDAPGQEAVLDRLFDVLLITWLRTWFGRDDADVPAWYAAYRDPDLGPVLRLLHDQPARPWTVAALAREASMSRAAFARRFTDLVGEPPMTHLTGYRLALAADLLSENGSSLESVARRVGYGSPFALSAAFTRHHGMTPTAYRAAQRAAQDTAARVGTCSPA
ncbi:AraC family transcriptional regulator [Thalassiella azotivora]